MSTYVDAGPARGHGAAVAPDGGIVVVFGRRPGTYALAIDAGTGRIVRRIARATDRWFSGHGVFSIDGSLRYATEIDAEGSGLVGVYRSAGNFARIGEFPSGGTDPHDIRLSADGFVLLVGNGGIRTDPNPPRARFDLDRIDSSLARLDPVSGGPRNLEHLDGAESLLSLRHLAVGGGVAAVPDGGFVMTSGLGGAFFTGRGGQPRRLPGGWVDRRRWDNHLVTLSGA